MLRRAREDRATTRVEAVRRVWLHHLLDDAGGATQVDPCRGYWDLAPSVAVVVRGEAWRPIERASGALTSRFVGPASGLDAAAGVLVDGDVVTHLFETDVALEPEFAAAERALVVWQRATTWSFAPMTSFAHTLTSGGFLPQVPEGIPSYCFD